MEVKVSSGWSWVRFWSNGGTLVLLMVVGATTGMTVTMSRAIPPTEAPGLRLDRGAVDARQAADREEAALAPRDATSEKMRELFLEQGRAEWSGEAEELTEARRRTLASLAEELEAEHGGRALSAMRAEAVERLEAAFESELDEQERRGRLGSYPRMLERYGLTREGRWLAPPFVVRTLYKARWNAIFGRPFTEGFDRAEGLAYYGWLALHASKADLNLRADALQAYAELGGERVEEAWGMLAFRTGDRERAAIHFARVLEKERSSRVRNHWLAAVGDIVGD